MKKLFNPFHGSLFGIDLFCLSLYSIFITFFFLHEGSKLVSFDLTDLSTFFYSEGTSFGVDIGLRVKWMYRFLIISPLLFVFVFLFLKRVTRTVAHLIFYQDLLIFAIAGIVLCIMRLFGTDSTQILSGLFFLFAFKLLLVVLQKRLHIPRLLLHPGIFNLSVSFGFFLLFTMVFLFGASDVVHKNYSTILFVGTIFFLTYYYFFTCSFKITTAKATSFLLPLTAIPIISLLSVELFFYFNPGPAASAHHGSFFAPLLFIFTLGIASLIFIYRKRRFSSAKLYKRFIVPSLLFAYVILTAYEPLIENSPDMFEPANVFNSPLRVFRFGQIPLLDFMSSHMLSEQWFTYLYSAIFGFSNDLSALSYNFLNSLIFVYVQYVAIKYLFKKSSYAVAFIFLFPFVDVLFYAYVLFAILPFFAIKDLFEHPGPWKLVKLFFLCCLLMIWRIDTGVVAVFGTAIFLPLMYFVHPEKISAKIALKGMSYILVILLGIFGITCLLRGPQKLFHSMQMFYHYVSGSQAHGHRYIYQSNAHQFYLYHIVYPLMAVAFCVAAIYLLCTRYRTVIFKDASLLVFALFLLLLYIAHLQRGLVRHGFAEYNDEAIMSVFPLAVALFITFFFSKEIPVKRFTMFFGSSFAIFILLKYFPFQMEKTPLENGFTGKRFYNSENPFEKKPLKGGRVIDDGNFAKENYLGLKKFMDSYLTRDQTFLDLSNTSMLYFYCDRKVPGYFNQNLENTIDDFLHFELLKEMDPKKIPMVISSSYPKNVNDAMDDIPNVMRHYILFEYMYTNYVPLGHINQKNIWVTPQMAKLIKDSLPLDPNTFNTQNYNYNLMAEYLGYHYTKYKDPNIVSVLSKDVSGFTANEGRFAVGLPPSLRGNTHCFLKIEFKKKEHNFQPYPLNVELLNDSAKLMGSFSFERRDKVSRVYLLRLSNHYLWHAKKVSAIQITKDPDILSLEVLSDNRPEYKTTNSH